MRPHALLLLAASAPCLAIDMVVRSTGGNATTPHMYGFLHEDINNAGDGGIYAELIRNRAFQGSTKYPSTLDGWSSVNDAVLSLKKLATPLSDALPYSVNVAPPKDQKKVKGKIGLANDGYWGMDVKVQKYTGSFWVRGKYDGDFEVSLKSALTGEVFGAAKVKGPSTNEWTEKKFELVPRKNAPNSNNTFVVEFDAKKLKDGSLDLNLISLFPPTYKNRKNGLRKDIAEALAGLHPSFLRFPGGNALEGNTLDSFYKWNETIGPLKDRPGMAGVWEYPMTNGLGIIEYLEWCEDMNLEPILGVWAGLALDGNFLSESEIGWAVQYALDELEFLTGDAKTTKWGAVRASLGYPKPWNIKYVEIGNEDWLAGRPAGFESYKKYRFPAFKKALEEKYPHIQLIASPSIFDDMVIPKGVAGDWHPYLEPDEFAIGFNKLDGLTKDNLTLVGEAASVHPNGGIKWDGNLMPFPWWGGSVAEGIFLISAERNADRVLGVAYAPAIRNMNRWQWSITIIQHAADSALTTRSTSWYVWELIARQVIKTTLPVSAPPGKPNFDPLYYVAGESASGTGIFKAAVYNSTEPVPVSLKFEGITKKGAKAELTVLTGPKDPYGYNDPFKRNNVVKTAKVKLTAGRDGAFDFSLPPLSVAVLETKDKIKKPHRPPRKL